MVGLFVMPSSTIFRRHTRLNAATNKKTKKISHTRRSPKDRNYPSTPFDKEPIKQVLQLTENGTEEIVSRRSKVFQELDVDLDDLSLKQLIDLIEKNPGLLRRPILVDDKRLQVGYNEDEIRRFLPRKVRQLELARAQKIANL